MLNYENVETLELKDKFVKDFSLAFNKLKKEKFFDEITFLCVGTDRIIGDCFGPLVGSKLKKMLEEYNISNINIY